MRQSTQALTKLAYGAHDTFWILLFVIFPLALDPLAFGAGQSAERAVLMPKALILGGVWVAGVFALLLSYPDASVKGFVKQMQSWPLALKIMLVLVVFLLVDTWLVPGNFAVNFIGSSARVDGFAIQAAWYSLALIAAGLVRADLKRVEKPLALLMVGAFLSALWALAQSYGFEPASIVSSGLIDEYNVNRTAYGPMSQSGLTAGYLAVALAVCFAHQKRLYGWMAGVVMILAAALAVTENRTAPAALVLVVIVLAVLHLAKRRYRRLWTLAVYAALALCAIGVLQITQPGAVQQIERADRLLQGADTSAQLRLTFWKAGLMGIFDRPLTGLGPNGFNQVFWRHLSAEEQLVIVKRSLPEEATGIDLSRTENIDLAGGALVFYRLPGEERLIPYRTSYDKAHNYLMDMTIASGWISTLLFIVTVSTGLIMMLQTSLDTASRAVAFGTLVYVIFGLTWFATLQVDPIVWGLFGVGIGAAWAEHDAKTRASAEASGSPPRSAPEAAA